MNEEIKVGDWVIESEKGIEQGIRMTHRVPAKVTSINKVAGLITVEIITKNLSKRREIFAKEFLKKSRR